MCVCEREGGGRVFVNYWMRGFLKLKSSLYIICELALSVFINTTSL